MRTWFYNILANLGLPNLDGIYSSGNGNDCTGHFIILSMGVEDTPLGMPPESRTFVQTVDVWVHDQPGSMLRIDNACIAIKDAFPPRSGAVVGGVSLLECRYLETSADAFDDQWQTNTRRVSFLLTCRR